MSVVLRPRTAVATVLAVVAALVSVVGLGAPARAATALPGSVLFVQNDNVYATDGSSVRQITTDGATPAGDGTGATGYITPSETNDGSLVVAVRNATRTSSDQQQYQRGYLWVMDGYGHVIRKINPPQFAYAGTTTCGMPTNNPQGISDAKISPDGKYIAYRITELIEVTGFDGCYVATGYGTSVVSIDGSKALQLTDDGGDAADLELGSWTDNTHVLIDRQDFGSVAIYRVALPSTAGVAWASPSDDIDSTYAEADVRNGILATVGYSEAASASAMRIWTTTGYGSSPVERCEQPSKVSGNDQLSQPSLSPTGPRRSTRTPARTGSVSRGRARAST